MGHEGVPMDSEGRSMMPRPQGRGYPQVVRSRPFADGEAFNFSLPLGAALPIYCLENLSGTLTIHSTANLLHQHTSVRKYRNY